MEIFQIEINVWVSSVIYKKYGTLKQALCSNVYTLWRFSLQTLWIKMFLAMYFTNYREDNTLCDVQNKIVLRGLVLMLLHFCNT